MSYPRDLEDYTANELWGELGRRSRLFNDGKCDYCGRVAGMVLTDEDGVDVDA